MARAVRNLGRPGVAAMAIRAVDVALWDLKARLLGLPLATLLGAVHEQVPIYGSGGFTSYTHERLADQLAGWVRGRHSAREDEGRHAPGRTTSRVSRAAREAIGAGGGAVRRRQRRLRAQAGARASRARSPSTR